MSKKRLTKLCLSVMSAVLCMGMLPAQAMVIEQSAPSGILRPYTFGFGNAQDGDEGASAMIAETGMEHLTFTDSTGYSINYWAYIPKDEEGRPIENLPVFVYMHGYSDGGGDNNIAVRYHNAIVFRLLQLRDDPRYQAVILVPQTPNATNPAGESDYFKDQWVGIKGADKWSQWNIPTWDMSQTPRTANLNAVVELIKSTQAQTNADVERAYVSGISMGGYTTWDLISRDDADMFAAAVPICGVGDPDQALNAADIPIRMYHGTVDDTINVVSSRIMYEELRKYGNVTYTEYSAEAHPSWNSAYSPTLDDDGDGLNNLDDLIDWMFNQSRRGTLDGSVDMAPLAGVIWDAQQEKQDDYAASRWDQLQAERERAQRLLENGTQEQVKESIRLMDAVMADTQADLDAVQRMRERAVLRTQRTLEQNDLDEQLRTQLDEAVKAAEAADGQAALLQAYVRLETIMAQAGEERDAMELERLSDDLTQLDLDEYPTDQAKTVREAQEYAQQILQDEQADEEAIASAYAGILQALGALNGEEQPDRSVLEYLIAQAEEALADADAYDQEDDSWAAFMNAYEAARAVRDDLEATAAEIEQAALALADAYADLRLLPDEEQLAQLHDFLDQVDQLDRTRYDEAVLSQIDKTAAQARAMIEAGFDEEAFAAFLPQMERALELMAQTKPEEDGEDLPIGQDDPDPAGPADTGASGGMNGMIGVLAAAAAVTLIIRRKQS